MMRNRPNLVRIVVLCAKNNVFVFIILCVFGDAI